MYIIYKTINNLNGKYYIGVHNILSDDKCGFYYGSGRALKKAIEKHGKENFTRETLYEFESLEECLEKEKEIVNEEFVKNPDTYNLTVGGGIPPNTKTWWTEQHSLNARQRMKGNSFKLGVKESEETKLKKSISMQQSTTIGRWQREDKHRQQIAERSKVRFLTSNPAKDPKIQKKIAESKLGRKKMIKEGFGFKYAKPDQVASLLELGYRLTSSAD